MNKVLHVPFAKVDDAQRMVYGYASTADRDSDGELITLDALKTALPAYMKFASVREMHDAKPVGKTKEAAVDENGLYIGAKIVDNDAWKMVKEEVYSAFSVGGKVLERDVDDPTIIKSMNLLEISLVDLPANPSCRIDLFKVADTGEDIEKKKDESDDDDDKDPDDDDDDDSKDSEDDPDKDDDEDDGEDKKKSAREQDEDEMLYKRLVARFGQEKADEICKGSYPMPEPVAETPDEDEEIEKAEDVEWLATALIEALYADFDVEKITALQSTAKKEEVRKLLELAKMTKDITAKAGSRHSRADMDSLQAIHDHASNMGASCTDNKAVQPGDLSKAYDKVRKLTTQLNEATESIDKLNKQMADKEAYIEKLKKTPAKPAPITASAELPDGLIAVSKGGGEIEDDSHLNREERAMKAWRASREQAFAKKI